jgi:methionyl-tRNA formyltransferase
MSVTRGGEVNITILCTDPHHPVMPWLERWRDEMNAAGHRVLVCHDRSELRGGNVLFLVSCGQIIRAAERALYDATLVLHASDLPEGRGWSPHIWAIVSGADRVTVSVAEAEDRVDTGRIWCKTRFELEGHELLPEINEKLFAAELQLMSHVVEHFADIVATPVDGEPGAPYRQRTAEDSRLDPDGSLGEQFNLLRVVDNQRYPAFFDFRGHRYVIRIEKVEP